MNDNELEQFRLETKCGEQVKAQLEGLEKILKDKLADMVWQACNDYVEFSTWEPLNNWKDNERHSLIGARYAHNKDCFWGKTMRAKIFEEHRDVIVPMIKDERFEAMEKEIAELKEELKREREWAQRRSNY